MNEKYFGALFLRHRKDFACFARWLTCDHDEADDLVHEAYCHAWRNLEAAPEDECGFIGWIFNTIGLLQQNRSHDHLHTEMEYRRANDQSADAHSRREHMTRPYRFMVFDGTRRTPRMPFPPHSPMRAQSFASAIPKPGADEYPDGA